MIYPRKIKWRNIYSTDKNLLTDLSLSDNTGSVTAITRESVYSTNAKGTRNNVCGYKYSDNEPLQLTFIKDDYAYFSMAENRNVLAWLTSSHTVGSMEVYLDDTDSPSYYTFGNFTSVQQYKLGGKIVGYEVEFERTSPYVYSPVHIETHTMVQPTVLTLTNDSDELDELLYPKIEYTTTTVSEDETHGLIITNNNTEQVCKITPVSAETITLDGTNKILYTDNMVNKVIGERFNWEWLGLQHGDNEITISGNSDTDIITFTWMSPMKLGDQ